MKVILITGASSGIGRSAAKELLAKGHRVYVAARRVDRMEDLVAAGATALRLDVTYEQESEEAVGTILKAEGRIDVLVNNAGYGYYGALETVSMDEARRQFDVNVFGLARLCQLVLPSMREHGGRIINVASMAGHFCEPRGDWYHATKYAVVALSECMRTELKPFGVKVILIEPGAIKSSWCDIAMDNMEECSRGTVYEKGASRHAGVFKWAYRRFATGSEVIGRAISHAALSSHPRIRYRKGFGSTMIPLCAQILPARLFDTILIKFFG